MDEHGNWSEDQDAILHVFYNEFHKRSKKDSNVNTREAIPLSTDRSSLDNDWLTKR